ncbi:hypothetical protein CDIK_0311 [Cucumispora dikerogammari]|nr:hypothetical protein CDIK_0311 [Cucumispora dikerogammari]
MDRARLKFFIFCSTVLPLLLSVLNILIYPLKHGCAIQFSSVSGVISITSIENASTNLRVLFSIILHENLPNLFFFFERTAKHLLYIKSCISFIIVFLTGYPSSLNMKSKIIVSSSNPTPDTGVTAASVTLPQRTASYNISGRVIIILSESQNITIALTIRSNMDCILLIFLFF